MGRILCVMASGVVLMAALAPADDGANDSGDSSEALSPELQAELEQCVATIRDTRDFSEAAKAYARGRAIDRKHAPLYEQYMHKTLELGQEKYAQYPAAILVRLQPENGLAWGILAYAQAEQGSYPAACRSALQAAALLPKDDGVLHNAGALYAWQQSNETRYRLTDEQKKMVRELEKDLNSEFTRAYASVAAAWKKHEQAVGEMEKKIAEIKSRHDKTYSEAREIDRKMRAYTKDMDDRRAQIRRYENDIRRWEREMDEKDDKGKYVHDRNRLRRLIRDRRNDITRLDAEIRELDKAHQGLANEGRPLLKTLAESKKQVAAAERELATLRGKAPTIQWRLPTSAGIRSGV